MGGRLEAQSSQTKLTFAWVGCIDNNVCMLYYATVILSSLYDKPASSELCYRQQT
jgi:hypothetical protein